MSRHFRQFRDSGILLEDLMNPEYKPVFFQKEKLTMKADNTLVIGYTGMQRVCESHYYLSDKVLDFFDFVHYIVFDETFS